MPRIRKSALSGSRRPAQLTASPIPPPNDGTSGELGFIQPRSSFSYQLPQLPQDVKSLFVWFTSNKHPLCLMYKYGQHTASLLWHDGQARWGPRKLSISKEREGAEIGQRMRVPSDNRLASCPSQACAAGAFSCCSNESLFHPSTCGWRITAILPATATLARFMPRLLAGTTAAFKPARLRHG